MGIVADVKPQLAPGEKLLTFDDIIMPVGGSGLVPLPALYAGLVWTGASAVTEAELSPAGLGAAVVSKPSALTNTPTVPGLGDPSVSLASPDPSVVTLFPRSVVMTQGPDYGIAAALGLTAGDTAGDGRIVVTCFSPAGEQLAAGTVRLAAGVPGRTVFPEACGGAARVVFAPAMSGMRLLLDNLEVDVLSVSTAQGGDAANGGGAAGGRGTGAASSGVGILNGGGGN